MIPTVTDGDCGIDAMLRMLGESSTLLTRTLVRGEIADFILERAKQRWFQEVMAACQEITFEDVADMQRLEEAVASEMPVAPLVSAAAVAGAAVNEGALTIVGRADDKEVRQALLDALAWSVGVKEESLLSVIAEDLHPVERDEQIRPN